MSGPEGDGDIDYFRLWARGGYSFVEEGEVGWWEEEPREHAS